MKKYVKNKNTMFVFLLAYSYALNEYFKYRKRIYLRKLIDLNIFSKSILNILVFRCL